MTAGSERKLLTLEKLHVFFQVIGEAVDHLLHKGVGLVYSVGVQVGVLRSWATEKERRAGLAIVGPHGLTFDSDAHLLK